MFYALSSNKLPKRDSKHVRAKSYYVSASLYMKT